MIRFGPSGLGGIKDAVKNLQVYNILGLKACEIAFTYGVYIKESNEKEIKEIRKTAEKLDIKLSIHAPYWINLNSKEKKKIEESKKRILQCCKIGEMLGVYVVVFHPGYYSGMSETETYNNIKKQILELQGEIKKQGWKVKLAPETTGKVNVFGKEEEILNLVKDAGCFFCVDFSHLFARAQGKITYEEIIENLKSMYKGKNLHCHFSGIEYGEKGEKNHKITDKGEWKKLLEVLPKDKDLVIINESPMPVEDSVKGLKLWNNIKL